MVNVDVREKVNSAIKILGLLVIIQIVRICIVKIAFVFVETTSLNNTITNSIFMVIFTIMIITWARKNGKNLSIMPNINSRKSKVIYCTVTAIVMFLIISTPLFARDYTMNVIIPLVYSTIIITIFEEILFRGYIWNCLKREYKSEFTVYIITTILFAIWHLGYFDSIMLNMSINNLAGELPFVMLMKVVTGLVFGIAVGFVRYKTKNVYASILTHSVMNIFGK